MHYQRALQIDPTSAILMTEVAAVYHVQRKYPEMTEQAKRIIELDPNFAYAYFYLSLGYEANGMEAETVNSQATMYALFGEPAEIATEVRAAYERDGIRGFWKKRLEQVETRPHLKYFPEFTKVIIRIRADDREGALRSLEKSVDLREHNVVYARHVPDLDPLRNEARYNQVIDRLGL